MPDPFIRRNSADLFLVRDEPAAACSLVVTPHHPLLDDFGSLLKERHEILRSTPRPEFAVVATLQGFAQR